MTDDRIVDWRVMCFEEDGDKLLNTVQLGKAGIREVQDIICPNDDQEMCGSYHLSKEMIEWMAIRFNNKELINCNFDLFIERDT